MLPERFDAIPRPVFLLLPRPYSTPETGSRRWAAALSIASPPLARACRIVKAAMFSRRASSFGPGTPSAVLVTAHLLTSHHQSVSVRTEVYEDEELGFISRLAFSEATASAERRIRRVRRIPVCHPRRRMLNLLCQRFFSRISLSIAPPSDRFSISPRCRSGWVCELLGQERASQRPCADPKPETYEATKMKQEGKGEIPFGDSWPIKTSTRE